MLCLWQIMHFLNVEQVVLLNSVAVEVRTVSRYLIIPCKGNELRTKNERIQTRLSNTILGCLIFFQDLHGVIAKCKISKLQPNTFKLYEQIVGIKCLVFTSAIQE